MRLSPKTLGIALALSLGLNLFAGGWIIADAFKGRPEPGQRLERFVDRMAERLSDADATILRQSFDTHREAIRNGFQQRRGGRELVREALEADPFDPAALDAAMEQSQKMRGAGWDAMQQAFREAAIKLSPEGRKALIPEKRRKD